MGVVKSQIKHGSMEGRTGGLKVNETSMFNLPNSAVRSRKKTMGIDEIRLSHDINDMGRATAWEE